MGRNLPSPWTSTVEERWHTGEFFLIHDELTLIAGSQAAAFGSHRTASPAFAAIGRA
jgi:hypothetical protein